MKKANKDAAREWHEAEEKASEIERNTERELELLRYAAYKRKTGFQSAHTLRECGMPEAASILEDAYKLIENAYSKAMDESNTPFPD